MKTFLLFIFSIIILKAEAQTSVYHPFPDSGIVWRQRGYIPGNCCCTGSGPCLHENNFQYFLNGDTIFGGVVYKKIYQTGVESDYIAGAPSTCPPWCSIQEYYYNNLYAGALRQDTTQRKVFFMPPNSSQDTLLYDFNLNLGDTLPSTWTNDFQSHYVSVIDSILIGNNYHKQFWISGINGGDTNYISIIEGIGSSYGLLSPFFPNLNVSLIYNILTCVTINNTTVYPDTSTSCVLVSKITEAGNNKSFSIFPNPFSEIINIELHNFSSAEIILYDVASRKLLQQTFTKSTTIKSLSLAKGIYIFELRSKNEVIAKGKLIKE